MTSVNDVDCLQTWLPNWTFVSIQRNRSGELTGLCRFVNRYKGWKFEAEAKNEWRENFIFIVFKEKGWLCRTCVCAGKRVFESDRLFR